MKVMAIFKAVDSEEEIMGKSDNLWDYIVDGITDIWALLKNIFKTDIDEKSIIIMPQYVTGFSIGKGFGIYKDKLAGEMSKLSEYHGEKNVKMSDSEDCLITISGKIVSFDLKDFYDGVKKETKGGSLLNRQKLASQMLEYGLNVRVINALSKWAMDSHLGQTRGGGNTGKTQKAENTGGTHEKNYFDELIKSIKNEEKPEKEGKNENTQVTLSEIDMPQYSGIRKSLVLIMFKETDEKSDMTAAEKAQIQEKEKLDMPGTDKMSFGNYIENMLDTVHYKPVRYMYFPEVEIHNYKEVIRPANQTEGEYIIEVKRPGSSKYDVIMANPMSEIGGRLKEFGKGYWGEIVKFFEAGFGESEGAGNV